MFNTSTVMAEGKEREQECDHTAASSLRQTALTTRCINIKTRSLFSDVEMCKLGGKIRIIAKLQWLH